MNAIQMMHGAINKSGTKHVWESLSSGNREQELSDKVSSYFGFFMRNSKVAK